MLGGWQGGCWPHHTLSCVTPGCRCVESYGPVCVGLFMNIDARWMAGWLLASHTLGCVKHNLYYMLIFALHIKLNNEE